MTARGDVTRYRLLASALAGRLVDVAAVEEERGAAWTDGATIFVDPDADPRDVVCAIVVQASLLACGSLAPDVVSALGRRASVLRRYLALEGHRAVAAQDGLLPAAARGLVDPELAARSDSPSASRELALGDVAIAAPPAVFGTIRPRQLRPAIDPPPAAGQDTPAAPRSAPALHEYDESLDRDAPVVDVGSSAVGRGGAVGRLLKKFFAGARSHGWRCRRRRAADPLDQAPRPRNPRHGGVVGGGHAVRRGRAHPGRATDVSRVGRQPRTTGPPGARLSTSRRRAKTDRHRRSAMCTRCSGHLRHDPAAAAAPGDRPSGGSRAGHPGRAAFRAGRARVRREPGARRARGRHRLERRRARWCGWSPPEEVLRRRVVAAVAERPAPRRRPIGPGAVPEETGGDEGVVGGGARSCRQVGLVERGFRTYPEWDVNRGQYRPALVHGCRHRGDARRARRHRCSVMCTALRRPLARLGLDLERRHRQLQGDDIDIDAAVEAHVATRAGVAPEEAIYIDCLRSRRDLSVLVLLDVSGSAAEPGLTGKTVHEQQQSVAGALVVALHELGDRVALYGFRSSGRSAVHVVPIKRFDTTLDARALRRLGALEPAGYTRLGAAIRHGAAVLEAAGGTPRRILVVISDGFAYDHGYEGNYGEADARRALAEARRRGTACRMHQRRRNDRTGRVASRVRLGRARNGPAPRAAPGCGRSALSCRTPRRGLPATRVAAHGAHTRTTAKSRARPDDRLRVPHAAGRAASGSGRAIECPA